MEQILYLAKKQCDENKFLRSDNVVPDLVVSSIGSHHVIISCAKQPTNRSVESH
jgi:hypothetical protein